MELLKEILSQDDMWMFYRITVGTGTLMIGIAVVWIAYILNKLSKDLNQLVKWFNK